MYLCPYNVNIKIFIIILYSDGDTDDLYVIN